MDAQLNAGFTQHLRNAVAEAKKLGYKPNYFMQMLDQYGGFETAQRMVASTKPSDGFTRLWELGRLDLTCEALIVETHWRQHFDPALVALAENRLRQMRYAFTPYVGADETAHPAPPVEHIPVGGHRLDGGSPDNDIRINAFFRDVLHAPVKNERWSWGGVDETRQRIFLRLWREDIIEIGGTQAIKVLGQNHTNRNGWIERQRHLELINSGYSAYAVLCQKAAPGHSGIGGFERSHLTQLDEFIETGGSIYMAMGERLAIADLPLRTASRATTSADLNALQADESIETTRAALIDARLGQGRFRRELLSLWDNACAVTGCRIGAMLRASHCKPWRESNNQERLDPHNGLPLVANLDALFDALLISFDDAGTMLVHPSITVVECKALGLPAQLSAPPSSALKPYLAYHRTMFLAAHT